MVKTRSFAAKCRKQSLWVLTVRGYYRGSISQVALGAPRIVSMSQPVTEAIQQAIEQAIEQAVVEVESGPGGGHFSVTVTAPVFAGKPMVEAHRLVYSAIAHLMDGDSAPVHAIDRLRTLAP